MPPIHSRRRPRSRRRRWRRRHETPRSRRHRARTGRLEVRVRPWYNPALESAIYIVPGVAGLILTLTLSAITSMSIVRERERGTLEQLIVTPVTRSGLMLGKILPFALVGYVQITVILLLGRFVFDVPIRGSLLLLYADHGAVHPRQPGAGVVHLHGREVTDTGDAAVVPGDPAVGAALGIHVPA